jgi:hypothetical protein
MSIRRVVPNVRARHRVDSRAFHVDVPSIVAFASPANRTAQVSVIDADPWGVRRFYAREPNGAVVNVMMHRPVETAGARPS